MRLVYSPSYDIRACGLERYHPFDSRKYSRAFALIQREFGRGPLGARTVAPGRPLQNRELRPVHSPGYLAQLRDAAYVASALEIPSLGRLPMVVLRRAVLRPMLRACAGSILAGRLALEHGVAVNLSGGYHHAKPEAGEGFCLYSDIALLVQALRADGAIAPEQRIAYVDLDAHQGNGVCHCFLGDRSVFIFDMFNGEIYPFDPVARRRIDCAVPLADDADADAYLGALQERLPPFLDAISGDGPPALLIYNAGTDILTGDPLGLLCVSAPAVLERDRFVYEQAMERGIPLVVLPSGGYTDQSHALIAESVCSLIAAFDGRS